MNVPALPVSFRVVAHAEWRPTDAEPRPDVSFVAPLERRRLTAVERAALAVAFRVWKPYADEAAARGISAEIPVVFASRWGEIGTTVKLMKQFHEDGEMSPAGFSASVHNAAPGAFSLFTRNHAPYTAIAAREKSFLAGFTEAAAMRTTVLYVYAEEATPEFYRPVFPDVREAFAAAFLIAPAEES